MSDLSLNADRRAQDAPPRPGATLPGLVPEERAPARAGGTTRPAGRFTALEKEDDPAPLGHPRARVRA